MGDGVGHMDDVMAAAINGGQRRDDDRHGVTTLEDRALVYRSVAALCGAGVTLVDALDRIVSTLAKPVGHPESFKRVRHHAEKAAQAIRADAEGVTVTDILDATDFLMYDVERCMLAISVDTAPRDLAVAFGRALDFVLHIEPRPGQKSRR